MCGVWVWMGRYGDTDGDILEKNAGRKYTTVLEVLSWSIGLHAIFLLYTFLIFQYFYSEHVILLYAGK